MLSKLNIVDISRRSMPINNMYPVAYIHARFILEWGIDSTGTPRHRSAGRKLSFAFWHVLD